MKRSNARVYSFSLYGCLNLEQSPEEKNAWNIHCIQISFSPVETNGQYTFHYTELCKILLNACAYLFHTKQPKLSNSSVTKHVSTINKAHPTVYVDYRRFYSIQYAEAFTYLSIVYLLLLGHFALPIIRRTHALPTPSLLIKMIFNVLRSV